MVKPLRDNVWLLFPQGDRMVDGVLVRQEDADSWMDAIVVATGPDVPESLGVGAGDTVLASVFDGMPLTLDGIQLRCVPSDGLLAVLE